MADDNHTRRIKAFCRAWGVERYAEDAAQENLALRLRGKGFKQSAKHAAIDALISLGIFTHSGQQRPPGIVSLDVAEHADSLEAQALNRAADMDSGVDPGDRRRFELALQALRPKHRRVLELILEDKTQREIGETLGFTESRVSQLRIQAVMKMQKILGIKMETRHCPCGKCAPFRVTTTSKQVYGSEYCQEAITGQKVKPMKRVAMKIRNEDISQSTSAQAGRIMVTAQELAEKTGKSVAAIYYNAKAGKLNGLVSDRGTVFDLEKSLHAMEKKPKTEKPNKARKHPVLDKEELVIATQESIVPRDLNEKLQAFVAPLKPPAPALTYSKLEFAKEIARLARSAPTSKVQLTLLRMATSLSGLLD